MADSARELVAEVLAQSAERYPDLPRSVLDTAGLSENDARLAQAIHRTALRRWITLEYLLDRPLKKPMARLEPKLRGVLLSAATQLLFMDRLPAYAVVDESVSLARKLVRPGAGGMVNAVLRKLAGLVRRVDPNSAWSPASDRLPRDAGCLELSEPCLPEPGHLVEHLSIATSHPRLLVRRWLGQFGESRTLAVCRHGVENPPVFVANEHGFTVWNDSHAGMVAYLEQDPRRRVQDPTAARAVESTRELTITSALDFCAGRGTKTRQLAALHPHARIFATDVDPDRRAALRKAPGTLLSVVEPTELPAEPVDLLLLDVPCSNSGVLARRPEARYRFSERSLSDLAELQRQIICELVPRVRAGGHLLYATCSIEAEENQDQRDWLVAATGAEVIREQLTLPAGRGGSHHDGGYFVLVRVS